MKQRLLILLAFLLCTTGFARQDIPSGAADRAQQSSAQARDMKADLQRMQALLAQMQKNAAFVSPGDTPLKHEFELEIEMWQVLLRDMDTQVDAGAAR